MIARARNKQNAIRQIYQVLNQIGSRSGSAAKTVKLAMATSLLSQILQDFETKSRGGTGRDGISWKPLKPETIAQRRVSAAEKKALGIGGKRVRGLLTQKQDKRWRQIFRSRLVGFLAANVGVAEAKARAAQIAWTILKSEGAKTKIGVLGGRQVDILRDTGELIQSITPGARRSRGQILEEGPGYIEVGTNKKVWHHEGVIGKLPARPFWPLDGVLPDAWWDAMRQTCADSVALYLVGVIR